MRTILYMLAALLGFGAFAQTNIPTRQMLADTNGVVKWPTNITRIRIGGTEYTNLLGFGLSVTNGQLSVDTTQLPSGGGSGVVTSVTDDFEIDGGELALTNALGTGPLVRQSAASGVGTVTSVGASTTVSGLGFSGSPVTTSGTISLTGTVAVASGGTGATDASGARTALSLVPGTDVQAYDADLAAVAALANSGIIVRIGAGTVSARTITGDSEAVVTNGDGVSGNPALTIGSAIARDSEVASTYAPLASPSLTGSPTVPTASAGSSNTVAASTAYVDRAVASGGGGGGGGGDAYLANDQTWTGTNTFLGPVVFDNLIVTNLTAETLILPFSDGLVGANGSSNAFKVTIGSGLSYSGGTLSSTATGGGETNTASNLGTPSTTVQGLYSAKSGVDLRFRSIEAGSGLTLSSNANTLVISAGGGGGGDVYALSNNVFAGDNTFVNVTVDTLNGDEVFSVSSGDIWAEGSSYGTFSDIFYPGWFGYAIASGSPLSQIATTNNPSVLPLGASANSSSGYGYAAGTTSMDIGGGGHLFITKGAFSETNLVVGRSGFQDSVTSTEPVDGAYIRWANGYLYGVLRNNSSETVTATSNLLAASSSNYYELRTRVNTDAASVTFWLRQATAPGVFTTVWTDSVTNTLPTGSSRLTGHGMHVYRTTGSAGLGLFNLDALGLKNIRRPTR